MTFSQLVVLATTNRPEIRRRAVDELDALRGNRPCEVREVTFPEAGAIR